MATSRIRQTRTSPAVSKPQSQATYSVSLPVSDFFSSLETNLTVGPVTEWFVTRLAAPTESDTFFVERIFVSHSVKQFGGALHNIKGHLALRGLKNQPFDLLWNLSRFSLKTSQYLLAGQGLARKLTAKKACCPYRIFNPTRQNRILDWPFCPIAGASGQGSYNIAILQVHFD